MMRGCVPICMVVALAFAPAVAQSVPQSHPANVPAAGVYRIAGTVVNAATGLPLQGAVVAVLTVRDSHTVATTTSDSEGRFAFERLAAAKYALTASKRGYRAAFYDEHEGFNTAIVTGPDQDTEHLRFQLSPDAVLHGVVTSDGVDPEEGARVMLFRRPRLHGPNQHTTMVESGLTDDIGAYEFDNLAPGDYLIAVAAQPWYALHKASGAASDANNAMLDVAYPITFFDSTTEEASATPITVTGGSREEANITLHAVPALRISVPFERRADGNVARPELRQFVFGLDVGAESAGFLDELKSGTVEFNGVAPGHYELSERDPPRIVELDATASEMIDPNAGQPSVPVSGTLRMPSGTALLGQTHLVLNPVNGTRGHPEMATAGPDGHFSFQAIAPGTWELVAGTEGATLPVRSIESGGSVYEGSLLTVRDRALDIVATVSKGATSIEGYARKDGKGFAGALVMLVPKNMALLELLSRRDQSDSDGSFALGQVVPGKYTIVAIEGGWELDWSEPQVMDRYLSKGTSVTVTDNSAEVVNLGGPVTVQPR